MNLPPDNKSPDPGDDLSDWQKEGIRRFYRYARDRDDRLWIMKRLAFRDLEQVYNTANREKATVNKQDGITGPASSIYDEARDSARLLLREDPAQTSFDDQVDRYIAGKLVDGRRKATEGRFGKVPIEGIAFFCQHTETAVMVRARHLGKRRFCKFWQVEKVAAWLGVGEAWLEGNGVEVHGCTDEKRRVRIRLVRTSALLRITRDPAIREELRQRGADQFFLLELDELYEALRSSENDGVWEPSRWISHGHICLNPRSGVSFMLFDDGVNDPDMPGRTLRLDDVCEDEDDLIF